MQSELCKSEVTVYIVYPRYIFACDKYVLEERERERDKQLSKEKVWEKIETNARANPLVRISQSINQKDKLYDSLLFVILSLRL